MYLLATTAHRCFHKSAVIVALTIMTTLPLVRGFFVSRRITSTTNLLIRNRQVAIRHVNLLVVPQRSPATRRQDRRFHRTAMVAREEGFRVSDKNVITSNKSATVKKSQALLSKRKKREEFGQTVVEGPRMVFDLLQNPKTSHLVRQILVSIDEYEDQYQERLDGILESSATSPHIQLVTPSILKSCSDTVTPQGILAIVAIPEISPIDEITGNSVKEFPFYLVLDGVSDPGNVGTLIRSSLAVGVAGILLLPDCCDVWNPKAVRSSMGASFQLPIIEASSWIDAVNVMTDEWNVQQILAATMMEGDPDDDLESGVNASRPHFDIDWIGKPSALIIGSEGNGLSSDVRQSIFGKQRSQGDIAVFGAVHVPMQSGIESLNAAVCGSVIMFEYARQCSQCKGCNCTRK